MDGTVLPPEAESGVSGVAEAGQAEVPRQDAVMLQQLLWLYTQKAEIETAIFNLLRKLAPDK